MGNIKFIIIMAILIMPCAFASEMNISISIGPKGVVTERFAADYKETPDTFKFLSESAPVSVAYEGDYALTTKDKNYDIEFRRPEGRGFDFTVLYADLIKSSEEGKVFKTRFVKDTDLLRLTVALPPGATLSDEPSAIPKPDSVTTDGKAIELVWIFTGQEDADIAVFYNENKPSWLTTAGIAAAIVAMLGLGFFFYSKKKIKETVADTLSENELLVVDTLRKGLTKQKEISQVLNFSKSRMSKVIRKLEEKGLIVKIPFFKTNKLKLKRIK